MEATAAAQLQQLEPICAILRWIGIGLFFAAIMFSMFLNARQSGKENKALLAGAIGYGATIVIRLVIIAAQMQAAMFNDLMAVFYLIFP